MTRTIEIHRRLKALAEKYPQLSEPVAALGDSITPNKAFIDAYEANESTYGIRSLILRILFEEPTVFGGKARSYIIDDAIMKRVVAYLVNHPRQPFDALDCTFKRRHTPKFVSVAFTGRHVDTSTLIKEAINLPYVRARAGKNPFPGRPVDLKNPKAILEPLYGRSIVTADDVERMLTLRTLRWARRHFDTGVPALDRRNALVFLDTLFQKERSPQIQSKIPMEVSKLLGTRRLSLPELMVFSDLLGLLVVGAMALPSRRRLPKRLHAMHAALKALNDELSFEDTKAVAVNQSTRFLMDVSKVGSYFASHCRGLRQSTYLSGFYFNTDRLLEKQVIAPFAPFYDQIDTKQLKKHVVAHYRRQHKAFGLALGRILKDEARLGEGLWPRSLANVLYYSWLLRTTHGVQIPPLPSVAEYLLGKSEPVQHRGVSHREDSKRPRKPKAPRTEGVRIPQLEALLARLPE
jgi:hypothetical protein